MNRSLSLLSAECMLTIGCLLIAGCAPSSNDDGTRDAVSKETTTGKPRIALVMKSLANEFFSTMAEGAKQHQQNSGNFELIVNGIKDETDLSGQVALVEQMMAQQVDAIVIAPADSKALVPVLKRAIDEGIIVINIDNKLDPGVLQQTETKIPFVGPDNREGAAKVGKHLATQLSPGGQVAILEGIPTSFNSQQRKLGFEDAMKAAGIVVVDSQSAQWEMSIANQVTSAILTSHPQITAILACNDSMALGAMAAIKAADRTDIKVVGFDNISAVAEALKNGQMSATADQHGDQLAVFGIDYALQALADDSVSLQDRNTPVDLVTAESLTASKP